MQFSLQVQNSGSPKECGVDSIRPNCLQLESSQPNLISRILRDSFFLSFKYALWKAHSCSTLLSAGRKIVNLPTFSWPHSLLLADL